MKLNICTCDCHDVNIMHETETCDCCKYPFMPFRKGNLVDVEYYATEVAKKAVSYYANRQKEVGPWSKHWPHKKNKYRLKGV